jgi:ankyrin repeat protein
MASLAIVLSHGDIFRLLAQKADVCYQSPNDYHRTCLHFAAQEGVVTIAEFLVQNGAKVDSTDRLGNTPLHYAVMNNHIAIVSLLIRHNAKCDIKNNEGIEEKIQRIE